MLRTGNTCQPHVATLHQVGPNVLFDVVFDASFLSLVDNGQPVVCPLGAGQSSSDPAVSQPAVAQVDVAPLGSVSTPGSSTVGQTFNMSGCTLGPSVLSSRLEAIHNNVTGATWLPKCVSTA